ncbi:hypothetical protein V8G54_020194 [Vigna mungo]|uniref:Uncharacterized protein n=1 Tax=Vigna mungo TaxID=3915 RepID=A0AAQ3NF18_VIGMU
MAIVQLKPVMTGKMKSIHAEGNADTLQVPLQGMMTTISARLALPGPEERMANTSGNNALPGPEERMANTSGNNATEQKPSQVINQTTLLLQENPIEGALQQIKSNHPIIEMPPSPDPERSQFSQGDIEDAFKKDSSEIPDIQVDMAKFALSIRKYVQQNMELQEGEMSKALVALNPDVALIPTPKLKNGRQQIPYNHQKECAALRTVANFFPRSKFTDSSRNHPGYVCVRGFDRETRAPRPLLARLHFTASRTPKTPKAPKTPKTPKKKGNNEKMSKPANDLNKIKNQPELFSSIQETTEAQFSQFRTRTKSVQWHQICFKGRCRSKRYGRQYIYEIEALERRIKRVFRSRKIPHRASALSSGAEKVTCQKNEERCRCRQVNLAFRFSYEGPTSLQ